MLPELLQLKYTVLPYGIGLTGIGTLGGATNDRNGQNRAPCEVEPTDEVFVLSLDRRFHSTLTTVEVYQACPYNRREELRFCDGEQSVGAARPAGLCDRLPG